MMMKKVIHILIISMIVSGLVLVFAGPSTAKPVKFKAVAFLPVNMDDVKGMRLFIDMVNKKFADHINIELIGGPEVTPPFQLHAAVKKGVIDMAQTSCAYYPSLLWEAQSAMFTNTSYKDRNKTDYYNVMSKLHENVGLIWLDSVNHNQSFHLYTNKKVKKLSDLAGLKIRVFPAFIPFIKALGAVPINLPMGDIYTAMERGAVDGFVMTHFGFVKDFSWHEVTKYAIDYDLYRAAANLLVNPKKWNQLPANIRQQIIEYKKTEVNAAAAEWFGNLYNERWQMLLDSGVKPLRFSLGEGGEFLNLAHGSAWDYVIQKSPEVGPKLKKMLVK
jgi:TRAP-type C4-dicarboxylate transport system substrate-binding protein